MKSTIKGVFKDLNCCPEPLGFETDGEILSILSLFEKLISNGYPWFVSCELYGKKFKITLEIEE